MSNLHERYDQKTLNTFTEEERNQLGELLSQHESKFNELVSLLQRTLGCSEADACEEAEQAADRWNEDVKTMQTGHISSPPPPLHILLRDHYEIGEAILDIEDQALDRTGGFGG